MNTAKEAIAQNNKIIAEFMEWEIKIYSTPISDIITPYGQLTEKQLKFHSDWNWLMEVVEKIESLENHGFTIYRKTTNINGLPIELANTKKATKIEAVYNACLEFIKWYNEQKSA